MSPGVRPIEARKPWRSTMRPRSTYFPTYAARLHALARRHGVPAAALKTLVEQALGTPDAPPVEWESKLASAKLAKMKVGPDEINWLFQYHVAQEGDGKPNDHHHS